MNQTVRKEISSTCKHRTYRLEKPKSFSDWSSRLLASWRPAATNLCNEEKITVRWKQLSQVKQKMKIDSKDACAKCKP